ncbi:uncharacterized protein [Montipora capricornis]|uniref:uncharacterized protein n=1 Tax=Montipora capricornis TaxID=246305 RepID=UPI0035F1DBA7
MLVFQRKLKTILMVLIVIYLCLKIYSSSRSIIKNEAQIAYLKQVLNKPLCVAHQNTILRLKRLTKDLNYVRMTVDRDAAMARIIDGHSDNLRALLREIELITRTSTDGEKQRQVNENQLKTSKLVCPEVYRGSIHGYPFYREGFETEECPYKQDIEEHVSLVFDDVVTKKTTGGQQMLFNKTGQAPSVRRFLEFFDSVYRLFPKIRTHFILGTNWNQKSFDAIKERTSPNVKAAIYSLHNRAYRKGELLQNIIDGLGTDYVLIAPSLTHFTNEINLERLLRVLSTHENTLIAGGSFRNLTGHWSNGCFQIQLKNYTLAYKTGYYRSFAECLVCDHLSGPFLAKSTFLRSIGLDARGTNGLYRDIFLRVKEKFSDIHPGLGHDGGTVVSCPDVMFHTQSPQVHDSKLVPFVNRHKIKKIIEADGTIRWFGCRRGIKHRDGEKCPIKSSLAVPPCCLENLADAIKFVMEQCNRNNLTCELQEGTLLGAVKMNKLLPWERDADITFFTEDFSRLVMIKDVFARQGYMVKNIKQPWCCVEDSLAGGKIEILADGWSIQMYGQHKMHSEKSFTSKHLPTKVFFSGTWLNAPSNPGLYVRNRYGNEVYKHAEHWLSTGKQSGWDAYEPGAFNACPVKGFHGCLDQYQPDGSIQFDNQF